jgi:hypothetical protein
VPIAAYFHPNGMTLDQFNEVHRLLTEAGAAAPAGRLHHSCFGEDGDLMVYDVWESMEECQAFGEVLMPIVGSIGLDVGEPAFMPIHRMEQVARTVS